MVVWADTVPSVTDDHNTVKRCWISVSALLMTKMIYASFIHWTGFSLCPYLWLLSCISVLLNRCKQDRKVNNSASTDQN